MIKYTDYSIVFAEIPDRVTLAINISNCTHRCEGCHSSYLRDDIGEDLEGVLTNLLQKYKNYVDCVCFLGEGNDPNALARCIQMGKNYGLETAIYSGASSYTEIPVLTSLKKGDLDYIKIGPYEEACGPISNRSTNQRLYKLCGLNVEDITCRFWRDK